MPRIARICAIHYPHHVTQRGNNREAVFFDDDDSEFYLKILDKYSAQHNLDIWAYCLMVNHVHLLAVPKREDSLAKGLGSTNLVYTQYVNRRYGRSGRVWQNRFFSAVIENEPYLWAVVRYIERNPVRGNLVEKAEEYMWSSARAHILGRRNNLLTGDSWLRRSKRGDFQKFMESEDRPIEDSIRKATSTGRPLGREEFMQHLEKTLQRKIVVQRAGRPKKGS